MYIINECVWWGKAGGRTPHCRQAEADKKVIHVWLTELRRYHNLLLVWLQMLLRIQIKAPSPTQPAKRPGFPVPASLCNYPSEFHFPSLLALGVQSQIWDHISGLQISAYIKI